MEMQITDTVNLYYLRILNNIIYLNNKCYESIYSSKRDQFQ